MKKWSVNAVVVIFAIFAGASIIRDFVTNDPISYFSTAPQQLFYVAAIAISGGLFVVSFNRMSPRIQRTVRIFAWGAAASTLTAIACYFAFCCFSLSSFAVESLVPIWILVMPLIFFGLAVYFWFEFYQALKTRTSR